MGCGVCWGLCVWEMLTFQLQNCNLTVFSAIATYLGLHDSGRQLEIVTTVETNCSCFVDVTSQDLKKFDVVRFDLLGPCF